MELAPALPPAQDEIPAIVTKTAHLSPHQPPELAASSLTGSTSKLITEPIAKPTDESTGEPTTTAHQPAEEHAVGAAVDTNPPLISQLTGTAQHPFVSFVSASMAASLKALKHLSHPSGFLAPVRLGQSFSFVEQAWHTTGIGNVRKLYSQAVPIHWARSNSWKTQMVNLEVHVEQVNVKGTSDPWLGPLADSLKSLPQQCFPNAAPKYSKSQSSKLQPSSSQSSSSQSSSSQSSTSQSPESRPSERPFAETNAAHEQTHYKISLDGQLLGYVADEKRAYSLAQRLKRLIRQADFSPESITPAVRPSHPSVKAGQKPERSLPADGLPEGGLRVNVGNQPLLDVDEAMTAGISPAWAAIAWANSLRSTLKVEPLGAGEIQMALKNLTPSDIAFEGDASWYGPYFHGRVTANGEIYDQNALTAAHKALPFGTHLKVRNPLNGRTVVVRVNDRGPYVGDRSLDLSRAAADCIGSEQAGVIPYEAVILKDANPRKNAVNGAAR